MSTQALTISVLGLNAHWQAIDVYTGAKALSMIYSGTATALNTDHGHLHPIKWSEWVKLPINNTDDCVETLHGKIRVPRIIISSNYKKMRKHRVALNNKNLSKYFGGKCAYTGEYVPDEDGSLDHIVPKIQGGKTTWDNSAWTSKRLNSWKGGRTPEEAGLKLRIKLPKQVLEMIPSEKIKFDMGIKFPEWENFLK